MTNCCAQLCFESAAKIINLKNIRPLISVVASVVRKKMLKTDKYFCSFEISPYI